MKLAQENALEIQVQQLLEMKSAISTKCDRPRVQTSSFFDFRFSHILVTALIYFSHYLITFMMFFLVTIQLFSRTDPGGMPAITSAQVQHGKQTQKRGNHPGRVTTLVKLRDPGKLMKLLTAVEMSEKSWKIWIRSLEMF